MRRTLFVATVGTGPVVERSSSVAVAANQRKQLENLLADNGVDDPARWLGRVTDRVLEALGDGSDPNGAGRSARQLTAAVPDLATKVVAGRGTRGEVELATTSRILGLMAVEGLLIRGRPSGGWTSRQYTWHRRDHWWPAGEGPEATGPPLDEEEAAAALVARWLARFGPATLTDLVWWTGWTKTRTRAALAAVDDGVGLAEVDLEGECAAEAGHVLADDLEPGPEPEPTAALLPALDPTAMGWKQRRWYLGPHHDPLFDRNGNIGPTVWVDGRIVGGWGQRPDGEIAVELLQDVGTDRRDLIDVEVDRLGRFVGPTVVKPSFATPLYKRLAAG